MQKKVQIVSDGSLDLPQEITDAHDIEVVPFYVSFNGETYQKEIEEIGIREFYQEMVDHPDVFPKSSMPSVDDFYQTFVKSAKENIPVICICITTKFSGSLQSATVAKEMVKDEYPEARITVIDSTVNTVLQGLYVLEACRMRDMGLDRPPRACSGRRSAHQCLAERHPSLGENARGRMGLPGGHV